MLKLPDLSSRRTRRGLRWPRRRARRHAAAGTAVAQCRPQPEDQPVQLPRDRGVARPERCAHGKRIAGARLLAAAGGLRHPRHAGHCGAQAHWQRARHLSQQLAGCAAVSLVPAGPEHRRSQGEPHDRVGVGAAGQDESAGPEIPAARAVRWRGSSSARVQVQVPAGAKGKVRLVDVPYVINGTELKIPLPVSARVGCVGGARDRLVVLPYPRTAATGEACASR